MTEPAANPGGPKPDRLIEAGIVVGLIVLVFVLVYFNRGPAPAVSQPAPSTDAAPSGANAMISPDEQFTTTGSGLKYRDLAEGNGGSPKMGDTVVVHYTGWLTNGQKFDSSHDRGQPATFMLGQVIEGWNEGLQSMKVGGKRKLVIPANLAYGAAGRPGIPPNSTLVFEVELLNIRAR